MTQPLSYRPSRQAIIAETRSWCGTPYRHQASVKAVGADCLGLLRGVYRALYGNEPQAMPPYAPHGRVGDAPLLSHALAQYLSPSDAPLEGGEVLLFQLRHRLPPRHIGIAVSPTSMVHALSGAQICEVKLTGWWLRHCVGRFIFPDIPATPISDIKHD